MIYFPVGCLALVSFIFLLPILFILVFFKAITFGFEKLGFSPEITILLFLLILIFSGVNIPITRKKLAYERDRSFFGIFKPKKLVASGVTINLGGAVIPSLISIYFLTVIPLRPALVSILLMIIVSKIFSKVVPGKGITISAFIPPLFAVLFAFFLSPEFVAPTAFVSGVFGTLIGADILNLRRIRKVSEPGLISIGGAGVFDGIFLVGIISALFS